MRWKLDWNQRYVVKSYLQGSLWLAPFFTVVFFWVFVRVMRVIGDWLMRTGRIDETTAFMGLGMTGARHLLDMIATANLSFLVFTFGSLLVAIQIAGGQYTPRIIATTLLRDNKIRYIVAYLLFSWLFAGSVANRMGDDDGGPVQRLRRSVFRIGLDRGVPLPDRLRSTISASRQHRGARGDVGARRHRDALSAADQGRAVG